MRMKLIRQLFLVLCLLATTEGIAQARPPKEYRPEPRPVGQDVVWDADASGGAAAPESADRNPPTLKILEKLKFSLGSQKVVNAAHQHCDSFHWQSLAAPLMIEVPRVSRAFMMTFVLIMIIKTLSPSSRKKPFRRANSIVKALILLDV